MKDCKKVVNFKGTWKDRPGTSTTHHYDSREDGKRIVVHKWADDGDTSVRAIKGNFWKKPEEAHEFEEVKLGANPSDELVKATVERLAKHF